MGKGNYIFIFLILFISCAQKERKIQNQLSSNNEEEIKTERLEMDGVSNNTLNDWLSYYKQNEPDFSLSFFHLVSIDTLIIRPGTILGNFDSNFEEGYSDFLVFRNDRKKYIDFDSYQWTFNDDKTISSSPDQEIDLIDLENETVNRIAFRGPSQWVEDVFWKNDSIVVLLENSYEKRPIINQINLIKREISTYKYNGSLNFDSKYSKLRFNKKGFTY